MLQRPARAGLSPLRLTAIPGPARTAVARRWRRTPATEEAILTTVPIASGRLVRAHLVVILLLAAGHLVTQWLRQVEGFESVYGLVDECARVGLIVRPFREGVRVSVGSREQNDLFYSVAAEFARTHDIGA